MYKSYDITYRGHTTIDAESEAEALDRFYERADDLESVISIEEIGDEDARYEAWRDSK